MEPGFRRLPAVGVSGMRFAVRKDRGIRKGPVMAGRKGVAEVGRKGNAKGVACCKGPGQGRRRIGPVGEGPSRILRVRSAWIKMHLDGDRERRE